jgi:hypothetical protein
MSNWIKDRLPTKEDAPNGIVLCSGSKRVYESEIAFVVIGEPWMPLPAPYVETKRWTVKWDDEEAEWILLDGSEQFSYYLTMLCYEQADAAQRIADAYNEVMP